MPSFVGPRRALLGGGAAAIYLLEDRFATNRAAGAVNGTPAEPGPGTRVVTDTGSQLSIANGELTVIAGAATPILTYSSDAQVRVFGKTVIWRVTYSAGRNRGGWRNGSSDYQMLEIDANSIIAGTVYVTAAAVFSAGTAYQGAVTLGAAGCYWFVKGGVHTFWTLIGYEVAGSVSPLIPTIYSINTTTAYTADDLRVPIGTFLPLPLAYDTFTRADGALGTSETVGPQGASQPVAARTWTGATWTISTNKVINTPNLGADVIVNGGFGTDTDWNKGTGWSIAAGVAAAVTATSDLTAAVAPLTVGTWYSVTYTLSGFGAGTVQAKLGSTAFPTHASNATYTETGLALTTAFAFTGVGFTGSIDNVSCKSLTLSELFATINPSVANILFDVNATLVSATDGKQVGIVTNLNSAASPTDFRLTVLDGRGNVVVYDCIAGAYTVKATTAVTYAAAGPLRMIVNATELRRFYVGLVVGALQAMGANTNTICGIFSTSPLSSLDVVDVMASGQSDNYYAGLDSF